MGIRCLEDASKQLIVVSSMLQGIYFAVISLSDIKATNRNDPWFYLFVTLSILILVFWMISLYFATLVFIPEKHEKTKSNDQNAQKELTDQAKEIFDTYGEILKYKNENLKLSLTFLWVSFPVLTVNIFIYLVCIT